jgi:hypothetical protein
MTMTKLATCVKGHRGNKRTPIINAVTVASVSTPSEDSPNMSAMNTQQQGTPLDWQQQRPRSARNRKASAQIGPKKNWIKCCKWKQNFAEKNTTPGE